MTVINAVAWEARPGRNNEVLARMQISKRIHERLGARIRVYRPVVAGPTTGNSWIYVMEFDSMSAYAAFSMKAAADAEWLQHWQNTGGGPEPAATLVNSLASITMPGLENVGPAAKGPGPRVVQVTTTQVAPGREAEVAPAWSELAPIIAGLGGRVTASTVWAGGPHAGQASIVVECDDPAAYGKLVDQIGSSKPFQAWNAKYRTAAPMAAVISRSVYSQVL